VIVGLDVGLIAEIEYSLEELGVGNKEGIKNTLFGYLNGDYNLNIENYYFENDSIFIHYNKLDSSFTRKFREYKLENNQFQLVVNN
jgi:hypothetical protein